MPPRRANVPGTLVIALLLALWEALVGGGAVRFDYLPAPSAIALAGWALLTSGQLPADALHTVRAVFLGWIMACAIGIGLGLALGFSADLRRYCLASVEVLRPLPGIAFLPVALLLFSFSTETELVVIVYPSIWPVLTNTMYGILSVEARLHDVSRTLRLTRVKTLTKVLIPAAAPAIVVGCRLSMGIALVMGIVAEMLGNPRGLGNAIISQQQSMQPASMFAYVLFVGVLGIAINAGLVSLARRGLRGHGNRSSGDA